MPASAPYDNNEKSDIWSLGVIIYEYENLSPPSKNFPKIPIVDDSIGQD
jgi:serine/threonine protein kinase